MIEVSKLFTLNDFSVNALIIKWEILDTEESLEDYSYEIYKSIGVDNEKTLLTTVDGMQFEYHDEEAVINKRAVRYYYSVIPVNKTTGDKGKEINCVAMFDKRKDKYASYIRYVNRKYLKVINNEPGYILVSRKFGQKCTVCWDDIRRQHKKSNCPNCFGTGYEGGYHTPYKIEFNYMNIPMMNSENVGVDTRTDNAGDVTIWTTSYPIISVGDIFVTEENLRYKVTNVQYTNKNNEFILRQILNLELLSPADVVYKVAIDKEGVL